VRVDLRRRDVGVNERARRELGWMPKIDFASAIVRLEAGEDFRSTLTHAVGAKGYHRTA
jgi:UDP-glucose 4-epimerase